MKRFLFLICLALTSLSPVAWSGPSNPNPAAVEDKKEVTVYITRTGACYHREGCSSLRKSKIPISKKKAIDRGYRPCKRCKP